MPRLDCFVVNHWQSSGGARLSPDGGGAVSPHPFAKRVTGPARTIGNLFFLCFLRFSEPSRIRILQLVKFPVQALQREQVLMRALFAHLAVMKHDNVVGAL